MNTTETPKIRVDDAVRLFGSKAKLARVLNITPQALTMWGEFIPELRVYKLKDAYPAEGAVLVAQASGGIKATT